MRLPILAALALAVSGLAAGVSSFATNATTLKDDVQEDLISRPYLRAGWVRVRADGATVTLVGRLPDALHHALVVQRVRNVPGVKVVKDRLEVDPKLERWDPTPVELGRIRLDNARRAVSGDPELGCFTTLHVARARNGFTVTGSVSSLAERERLRTLLEATKGTRADLRVTVDPDASRRSEVADAQDDATRAFAASVTEAIASEPLLRGLVSISSRVERGVIALRGRATDLVAHDFAVEIARAKLRARHRDVEHRRAGGGELTKLLAGDPGTVEGEVPARVESLVIVDVAPRTP